MDNNEIKELMNAQVKVCEHYFNLPKRDLALHASLATKPDSTGELLDGADKIFN